MHREISHADEAFQPESHLTLYLFTGLLALIIGADLWPILAAWEPLRSWGLPTWPRELFGFRIALIAAILGGVRTLYGSLEGLFEGRLGADLALALAVIAAILAGEPLVAAEVVFIGLLGECLESFTFERTRRAVRLLVEVFPRRCWLLRDGQEVHVLTSEVHVGDRVVVKPGCGSRWTALSSTVAPPSISAPSMAKACRSSADPEKKSWPGRSISSAA